MAPASIAQLPDELILSILDQKFPCRQPQTRALATLISPDAAPCKNCIVYGTESTGKTAIVTALLQGLSEAQHSNDNDFVFQYAIINSAECVTGRHLFETTVRKVAEALGKEDCSPRCENLAQLTFELSKMLKYPPQPERRHFVLVFDAVDRQRDAPPTLLPALGRLSEIIPCLTTVFIMTNPPPNCLRTSFVAHVHFPNFNKAEFVKILSATPPKSLPNSTAAETADLWTRFCGAVHDALTKSAARTLPALELACNALWRRFTAPIREGNLGPKDFSKLLIASRVHFQDETLLDPGIIRRHGPADADKEPTTTSLAALLPSTARILLVAAYLASHNATRHDLTLFSTYHHNRRKRRGGMGTPGPKSKHRKIARKLLGAHAFVLERMMAIFSAVRQEWGISGSSDAMNADVGMALATLSSLRLLVRAGGASGGDPLDRGGKWRVNVGWEVIRSLGRSLNVEVEEWLIE
ncbi:Origin recognition complex subunit 5 [Cytospora mali]|uniref:Origin recognition complex subunit 5 n=1 Tax=Cytospora mali TaxID=578113 RepID=A0A194WBM3_CYTMA|nr:Origin recognition complex subunit 5 [Valsa mali]